MRTKAAAPAMQDARTGLSSTAKPDVIPMLAYDLAIFPDQLPDRVALEVIRSDAVRDLLSAPTV
jgi:hypothetical protein